MKTIRALLTVFAVLCLLSACTPTHLQPVQIAEGADMLSVAFLDVGQGDSIFVRTPGGKTMLIDAGEAECGSDVVSYIKSAGADKIDILVATHPHSDHIGGLKKVISAFEIGEIYMPKVVHTSKTYTGLLEAIDKKGCKIKSAKNGVKLDLGSGIKAQFLAPFDNEYDEINNYSAVLKMEYKDASFLFTGDAEKEVETELVKSGCDLFSDVLKVAHHGSNSSCSEEFLKRVSPQAAIISVGKNNSYKHPDGKTLERLKTAGAKIFRTDESGTVTVLTDGNQLKIREQK